MTAGYIGSKGVNFKDKLPIQRDATNVKRSDLKSYLQTMDLNYYGKSFNNLLNNSLSRLDKLDSMRGQISSLSISGGNAIGYYTNMNGTFIEIIRTTVTFSTDIHMAKELNSYTNFLLAKERAGIERAIGAVTFAENKFLPGMRVKFNKLVAEQDAFLYSFTKLTNQDILTYYNNTVQGNAIDEVTRMRNIALNANSIGGFGVNSSFWFDQITSKINKLF